MHVETAAFGGGGEQSGESGVGCSLVDRGRWGEWSWGWR